MTLVGALFSLGLATAIGPCPLATNLAALSYLARRASEKRWVVLWGLLYMLGRALAYLGLAVVVVAGLAHLSGRFGRRCKNGGI